MDNLNVENLYVDEQGIIHTTVDIATLTEQQQADTVEWKAAADRAAFLSQRIEKRQVIVDEAVQRRPLVEEDGGVG